MTTAGVGDAEVKRGGFHGNEELLREAALVLLAALAMNSAPMPVIAQTRG